MTSFDLVTAVTDAESDEVFTVYDAVFGDQPDQAAWRRGIWDRHAARGGFRLARAYQEERLVGFGYGYTGERGQWWTDQAARVLGPELADTWVGGHFELVSIGVLEDARGGGVGRVLMDRLCAGLAASALAADDHSGRRRPGPAPLLSRGVGGARAGSA